MKRSELKMDKGIVFRETFRGYNKDDVNEYIKNINDNFVSSEEEYKKEISKKTSKLTF